MKFHPRIRVRLPIPSTLLSLAILVGSTVAQQAARADSTNCTVFNWDQQPGYLINGTSIRVSGASTCAPKANATHDCPITATGDQDASFSYNVSSVLPDGFWNTKAGGQSFLYNLILNVVNSSLDGQAWDDYIVGTIDTTQGLPPNTSGYIDFLPLRRCFEGTMGNCSGDVQDGLAIQACAPVITIPSQDSKSLPILDGTYSVVGIPKEDVGNYGNPYAGEARGEAGHVIDRGGLASITNIVLMLTIAVTMLLY